MPRTPTYRIIDHDEMGESVVIKTSYDPDFVTDLKAQIPAKGRRWDPDLKVWCVDREYEDEAFAVVSEHFGDEPEWDAGLAPDYPPPKSRTQYSETRPPPEQEGAFAPEMSWSVLGLVPAADPDVAKAAYRILSRKWHPDRGGSNEKMTRLNLAWEYVKKIIDATNPPKPEPPKGWAPTDPNDDDGEAPF